IAMAIMSRGYRRYILIGLIVLALPIGVYAISKWRGVGFFDMKDGSITWRLEIWREGLALAKKHPIFGIGRGSALKLWAEWEMYENDKLPPGHFHSTPLQIAVWWGLPALLFYIAVMVQAIRMLINFLNLSSGRFHWQQRAIVLGALGALIGFNLSSL